MIDLHIHLGGAVPSSVLWEILCDNGLRTTFRDFDAFHDSMTVDREEVKSLDDFLGSYFTVTELIQSSPAAASVSAYQLVAKAYRRAQIEAVEMRYNPMKRMRENVHTLEAIILATTQGLERASMHYNVATGIILSMGRDLSLENNWKIAEAACAWHSRGALHGAHGVVGLDVAGPESGRKEFYDTWLKEVAAMFEKARSVGLGTTYHIGETDHTGVAGIERVLDTVQPDRIGHGIALRKADDTTFDRIAGKLKERGVLLEICPSVNLITRSIADLAELAGFAKRLRAAGVPFNLNTDNPYLIHTNLKREYDLMADALGDDAGLLEGCHADARRGSFLQIA